MFWNETRRLRLGRPAFIGIGALFLIANSVSYAQDNARELASNVINALGGLEAWETMPALAFDFVSENDGVVTTRRSHAWNKQSGSYMVEWTQKDGKAARAVYSDIYQKQGECRLNGAPAPDSLAQELIDRGYAYFINDTYWLMMPFKLFDPGVKLKEVESEQRDGVTYRILHLSFENVGLTPGDQYWLYIEPDTFLIKAWRYELEGGHRAMHLWEDYQPVGPVNLSLRRPAADSKRAIRFDNVSTTLPDGM